MAKAAEYYKRLPYTRTIELVEDPEDGTYFLARISELDGVMADGESAVQAYARLDKAFESYLDAMIQWGDEIPLPAGMIDSPEGGVVREDVASIIAFRVRTKESPDNHPEPSPWRPGAAPRWRETSREVDTAFA